MKKFFFILSGSILPQIAQAVSITDPQYGWSCTGFLFCGQVNNILARLTTGIVGIIYGSITAVAVIAFIYGGLRMVVSQGEEGKEVGKKAMIYAAVGLILANLTFYIVSFVQDLMDSIP